jgi:hypothetical protein
MGDADVRQGRQIKEPFKRFKPFERLEPQIFP